MIPILLNILRRTYSPVVLGAAALINLQAIVVHSFAFASHNAEVQSNNRTIYQRAAAVLAGVSVARGLIKPS